jgi:hypothetical protein
VTMKEIAWTQGRNDVVTIADAAIVTEFKPQRLRTITYKPIWLKSTSLGHRHSRSCVQSTRPCTKRRCRHL